jgi:hypothetical protein
MPEFKNREEYEKWKNEKIQSNLEKVKSDKKEHETAGSQHSRPGSNQSSLNETGMRSLEVLFRDSWELFKGRFITLISLYLLSIVFLFAFLIVFIGIGYIFSAVFPGSRNAMIVGGTLIGIIPGFIAMFWGIAAFTGAVVDETLSVKDALEKGWQRAGSFIWLSSLLGFLVTGGFLFLIIPGVIFLVWFIFAQFIIFAEDDRGMNAILKSKEYVRGKWFDVFLRLLVIWLVAGGIGMVPFLGPILSLLFFPFAMIFIYLVYQDLRVLKGRGMMYPHSTGEKFKWIGVGTLGYFILPIILIALMGATITIPLLMLKGMLCSQGQQLKITPWKEQSFTVKPESQGEQGTSAGIDIGSPGYRTEKGISSMPEVTKPDANGEAVIIRDGLKETYVLKTGFYSDTHFSNPQRASIEFQIPAEQYSNARRIEMTLDATRTGRHLVDGKAIMDTILRGSKNAEKGQHSVNEKTEVFKYIADGGQIFLPKDFCSITITSPYTGTPESIFAGEVNNCVVHSAGIDHTISAQYRMTGISPQ